MTAHRLFLLLFVAAGCRVSTPAPAKADRARALELVVDARRPGPRVSPRLFGTNLEPNAEVSGLVIERARGLGVTTYRFPGGGSPGWRWRTGALDKAPEMRPCPLARIESLQRFLAAAGGEAVMQLNIETGTPEEAAGLLRWMRDPAHPIRGDYFEVGNEPYGDWDAAYRSPEAYAETVRGYAAALRAVDPKVKVGALLGGPYYDLDLKPDGVDTTGWDRRVLEGAGEVIDFVSVHWYPGVRRRENPLHVMGNSLRVPSLVERIRGLIVRHAPARRGRIEIGFLEWDGVFDQEQTGLRHSLANAIFYVDALMQMARARVALANQYELHSHSYGLLVGYDACMKDVPHMRKRYRRFDGARLRPKALALQLAARMAGGELLDTRLEGNASYRTTTRRPADEHRGAVPYWAAYAARHRDRVTVLVISRHPGRAARVRVRLRGFVPRVAADVLVLDGPSLTATNEERAGTVRIRRRAIEAGPGLSVDVPPASVTLIELRR